jgi:hypothetical protein
MVGTVNSFLGMSRCALHNQSSQRWSGDTAIECSCGTSVRTQALDVDIAAPYSPQYFRIDRLAPQAQTPLVTLNYIPNTIASLQIPDTDERLLAAGGQDSELHLSIHSRRTSSPRNSSNTASPAPREGYGNTTMSCQDPSTTPSFLPPSALPAQTRAAPNPVSRSAITTAPSNSSTSMCVALRALTAHRSASTKSARYGLTCP